MIQLPTFIMKAAAKITRFGIKHGPRIMSITGAVMAVGGAVMACNATLKAEEVLEHHKAKMSLINEARAHRLAVEEGRVPGYDPRLEDIEIDDYSEEDAKRDKLQVYLETGIEFAKLYAPAVAVGLGGVFLMQGAFGIMDKRHSVATASLTALHQSYEALANKVQNELPEEEAKKVLLPWDEEEVKDQKVKTPSVDGTMVDHVICGDYISVENFKIVEDNPFVIVYDTSVDHFEGNYLLDSNSIATTMENFERRRSIYGKPQIWVNDIRRAFDQKEFKIGWSHGWNSFVPGDVIEYELIPYFQDFDENYNVVGYYHPNLGEEIEYESDIRVKNDLTNAWIKEQQLNGDEMIIMIVLHGNTPTGQPRMISQEVFG